MEGDVRGHQAAGGHDGIAFRFARGHDDGGPGSGEGQVLLQVGADRHLHNAIHARRTGAKGFDSAGFAVVDHLIRARLGGPGRLLGRAHGGPTRAQAACASSMA